MKKIYILCLCIFAIDSFAEEVSLTWYDNGTQVSGGSSSCTIGGTFSVPPAPPARTGYIFAGWKIKPETCGIDQFNTGTNGNTHAFSRLTGATGQYESTYGITRGSGQFAVPFSYGTVWGMGNCNNTTGTYPNTGTPTLASSGTQCWCQVNGFSPSGSDYTQGPQCTTAASSLWMWHSSRSTTQNCAAGCPGWCAYNVQVSTTVRTALFGAVGQ